MWQMVWDHKIQSLFQMEQQSGATGIDILKPKSVDELAILNSTIRLMPQEKNAEMPTNKLARFKNDPTAWDEELKRYKLGKEEKKILEPVVGISYGLCIAQEQFMELVQLPELGGFSLTWADRLRKSVAKKAPKDFEALTEEFYEVAKSKEINPNFAKYVWQELVSLSRGYGFNQSHTLAYSLVALQEMNLCFKYPILFWNTACLISDSGSEDSGTNYDKIASAINKFNEAGVKVGLPDINKSSYRFEPDIENNQILFGLKGMLNIGDDIINNIINNRPYISVKDFYYKIKPDKKQMVPLIKGGVFDSLMDRKECMVWYIWETCDKKKKLNLQNLSGLMKYKLVPEETEDQIMARRIYEFNRYLKAITIPANKFKPFYALDERALAFLVSIGQENIICRNGEMYCILKTDWDKIYQKWMDIYRQWISQNHDNILKQYNNLIFLEDWKKYAKGNYSSWEMEALCFYYHEHELSQLNNYQYGFSNFSELSPEPEIERYYTRNGQQLPLYKIFKICGTCIAKNKHKSSVTLLTTDGVVNVKINKEVFAMFDKQISAIGEDGKKHRVESSWFNRGSMIVVQGIRRDDSFIAKKYQSTGGHLLYKIDEVIEDQIILRATRAQGMAEDEEE